MNTKGVDHIEMILSFVIFVGALMAAFTFFHPFSSSPVSSTLLDQIYTAVEKDVGTDVVLITVMIDKSQIATKHKFTLIVNRAFPDPWQVKAATKDGIVLNSEIIDRTTGKVEFDWGRLNKPFVTLMFAKEITPSSKPVNAKQLGIDDSQAWQFVTSTARTVLSEKKVSALRTKYEFDSAGTKTSLGVPPEVSYGFQFLSASGTTITDVSLQRSADFRIKSKRADALLANDNIEYSELGVGIW